MNAALAQLQEKQAALAEAQEKLREVSLMPVLAAVVPLLLSGMLHYHSSFPSNSSPLSLSVCLPLYALFRWAVSG